MTTMTTAIEHITFDCADPIAVATFWAAVLGETVDPDPQPWFATIGYPHRGQARP
ncbi:MAG: VOC family protein, partial [Nocardioides sp.]